ncbi:MAG TPA: DNA/RNA nuclease SfsA [Caldithrix abyssi]|uniref:Sugar fermentation stimulation protein homolog n=1 Tax=Caldithrix abyssi TaxID=187145 RepID=A0A7V4U2X0_CALAY|nr:DNA/RNA nuclease SfsA [Caldithrix abyssi]
MKFKIPLIEGTLIKRYKRFLADVRLKDGCITTAHCPNSGSMKTCKEPGWRVMLSDSNNPKRKLRYTWEMVHNGRCWIGINTHLANRIAREAIENGTIDELTGYEEIRSEVRYGQNSRIDLLLSGNGAPCYVEIKNVTLVEEDGHYYFPDAVTERGRKHLGELEDMVRQGHRAVMLFIIQRSDGDIFKPADHIDTKYGTALRQAVNHGVEALAYRAEVTPEEIYICEKVEMRLYE